MKLSIIIPYYNSKEYTDELLACLDKQINPLGEDVTCNPDIEVIVVDDGSKVPYKTSYKWCKVIRKKNGGCATARNRGLKIATGEYIQFIDSDDMIPDYFIEKLIDKIESGDYEVIDFSWRSLSSEGNQHNYMLSSDKDFLPNPSVCTRCFKRSYIGSNHFNELKDSTEDEDFSRKLGYLDRSIPLKHGSISDYMYFYRTAVDNSKIKRFKAGKMNTKRIVYFYNHFKANMLDEFEQIKKDDERNEVWLLTNQCDMPEVKRYAQVHKPFRLWTHYVKGEPYSNVDIIEVPFATQIVLYINQTNIIGGLDTFTLNFAKIMSKYYDITFVVNKCDDAVVKKISKYIRVIKGKPQMKIYCDTLIMLRILDTLPNNIIYNKSIQMCHACKTNNNWHIPQNTDYIVTVSQASKDSFGDEGKKAEVIHNLIEPNNRKALMLVSATRIPAADKGQNEKRMIKLAEMLNTNDIPFIWLNFSDGKLQNAPKGFYNMGTYMDITPYIAKADYLVQLSDCEAWSYAILEALTQNVPVLTCPFDSVFEMGIENGKNGYILPFDMDFDIKQLLDIPKFTYNYNVSAIVKQWRTLIGKSKPFNQYKPNDSNRVRVIIPYYDIALKRTLQKGEVLSMTQERINIVMSKGLIELVEG